MLRSHPFVFSNIFILNAMSFSESKISELAGMAREVAEEYLQQQKVQ
jgi:hypothetical protein